jgi:hypothetical protein
MAPKKKADMPDDLDKAKADLNEKARAVTKAVSPLAESLLRKPVEVNASDFTWDQTVDDVNTLDKEFQKESLVEALRNKFRTGEMEVRVMQMGPGGRLTDVSDRIKPEDLKSEDIGGIQTEDGSILPLGRNPQSKEAALRMLQDLLRGKASSRSTKPGESITSEQSLKHMEIVLAESDKILNHWKE